LTGFRVKILGVYNQGQIYNNEKYSNSSRNNETVAQNIQYQIKQNPSLNESLKGTSRGS
jgi:hypothetical protein